MIAERVQTLGGIAIADPRHVAEVTKIARPPDGAEEVPAMLSRLLEAHELIIGSVRDAITATATNRDDGTNDLLMGDVLRRHELPQQHGGGGRSPATPSVLAVPDGDQRVSR
jgi:starvation-inducible DNA-binding protein